jgi:predicted nucleic acid-binding protein
MLMSAALIAGCETLFSGGMQGGFKIDRQLQILNLFGSGESFL